MLGAKPEAEMGYVVFFIVVLASLFIVDYLARERGWNRHRWAVAAVLLGPLAIPLIYLTDAAYAVRKMISAPRT
jgi:UDP-N-acetylmuramyl pentapeptide phosphotransferase/UDP-N-acetylglucosamine-1-phosphate transferase